MFIRLTYYYPEGGIAVPFSPSELKNRPVRNVLFVFDGCIEYKSYRGNKITFYVGAMRHDVIDVLFANKQYSDIAYNEIVNAFSRNQQFFEIDLRNLQTS